MVICWLGNFQTNSEDLENSRFFPKILKFRLLTVKNYFDINQLNQLNLTFSLFKSLFFHQRESLPEQNKGRGDSQ